MIDDYLKKLESLITPSVYNKNNYKDKLQNEYSNSNNDEPLSPKGNFIIRDNKDININNNIFPINTEENKTVLEEYLNKMGIKEGIDNDLLNENKKKVYQKMLEQPEEGLNTFNFTNEYLKVQKDRSMISNSSKRYSLSPSRRIKCEDEASLREKIHLMNIKAMSYRHEIEKLKDKIQESGKIIEEQNLSILKLERQKENDNKYLLKMEAMLSDQRSKSPIKLKSPIKKTISTPATAMGFTNKTFSRADSNVVVDYLNKTNSVVIEDKMNNTVLNINDSNDLKEYISKLMEENRRLKTFQLKVFDISKNYDNINAGMIEGIKNIQKIVDDVKIESNLNNLSNTNNKINNVDINSNIEFGGKKLK